MTCQPQGVAIIAILEGFSRRPQRTPSPRNFRPVARLRHWWILASCLPGLGPTTRLPRRTGHRTAHWRRRHTGRDSCRRTVWGRPLHSRANTEKRMWDSVGNRRNSDPSPIPNSNPRNRMRTKDSSRDCDDPSALGGGRGHRVWGGGVRAISGHGLLRNPSLADFLMDLAEYGGAPSCRHQNPYARYRYVHSRPDGEG